MGGFPFGSGSKPCTPGEHQNSWDLWMFIPLKMVLIGIDPYPFFIHKFNGLVGESEKSEPETRKMFPFDIWGLPVNFPLNQSIYRWIFHEIKHSAIGVPPFWEIPMCS